MARFSLAAWLTRTPKTPPAGETAASGMGHWLAPYIGELPLDPTGRARYAYTHVADETHALQTYRNVLRDERCSAALEQRLNAAISKPWEVEPGGEDAVDKAAAEDLAEQLKAIPFDETCRQLLHGVWFGWAVGEAMWARDGNRVVIEDLVVRSLDRFTWSTQGELLLRTYTVPQGQPVPDGKFVVLTRPGEHRDLPYAPGLARWCYWPVWFKRHGWKFWAIALEKFGAPTAKGVYPKGATEQEKKKLLDVIQSLATGAGIAIPEDQEVELLATAQRAGGSGGIDFEAFVKYLDQSITTTILGQSSTTDQGPWRGTAEVQKDVRDETVTADCRLLDETLNATIARWLTQWNFPSAAVPKIRHDADPREDLDARAKREEVVSRTTGLRPTKQHVIDIYGGEWEEAPEPTPPPAANPDGNGGGNEPPPDDDDDDNEMAAALAAAIVRPLVEAETARSERFGALCVELNDKIAVLDQTLPRFRESVEAAARAASLVRAMADAGADGDAIDAAVDDLIFGRGWRSLIGPTVEPVLADAAAALERGEDLDAWRDRLPSVFGRMDDSVVVETLRRMAFSAHLSGDAGLE